MPITTIQDVFIKLKELDNRGIESIIIDKDGCLKYLGNMPEWEEKLVINNNNECIMNGLGNLYTIPRIGDLLLGVKIIGKISGVTMFQYDWTGSNKVKYCSYYYNEFENNEREISPFPDSGYPLLTSGKPLYVEVLRPNTNNINESQWEIECYARYAFLDTVSRKRLIDYIEFHPSDDGLLELQRYDGIKVKHENN